MRILHTLNLLVFSILLFFQSPSFAASADAIAAKAAWDSEDYAAFLMHSRKIEEIDKSFNAAYNVALGHFRLGQYGAARSRIAQIIKSMKLSKPETTLLAKLTSEIDDNERYHKTLVKRHSFTTGGTLSSPRLRQPDTRCQGVKRHERECQDPLLSPEEIHQLMEILSGKRIARDSSSMRPQTEP